MSTISCPLLQWSNTNGPVPSGWRAMALLEYLATHSLAMTAVNGSAMTSLKT